MIKDLVGSRFGYLSVTEQLQKRASNGGVFWRCQCDCGETIDVDGGNLRRGMNKSCGCERGRKRDLLGYRFGRLKVTGQSHRRDGDRELWWNCICDCGNSAEVPGSKLTGGRTQSCGCSKYIDFEGMKFRSRWELYWYVSAQTKGVNAQFETERIDLLLDGRKTSYIPDFYLPDEDRYIEVKGLRRDLGMKKLSAAEAAGFKMELVLKKNLEDWCGMSVYKMDKAFADGGPEAIKRLLSN